MTAAPGPQQPDEVRQRVHFACIGHPGWPDPLWVYTPERAQSWLDEHRERFPGIRVEKVTTLIEPFRAAPSAQPDDHYAGAR